MKTKAEIASRIAFIHGRPEGHPRNREFARSVKADFYFVDRILPYSNRNAGKLRRYFSWILNALFFPNRRCYHTFLTEGIRLPQPLMKYLGLIKKDQKLVGLMVGEELYFLYSGYYNFATTWIMKLALRQYDLLLCKGHMQAELASKILLEKTPDTFPIINGIPEERFEALSKVEADLSSYKIILLANGPGGFRLWYKGIDLMIDVVSDLKKIYHDLSFTIVGDWDAEVVQQVMAQSKMEEIYFKSAEKDISQLAQQLQGKAVFLLLSRGDCFPNASLEAMAAGIVPFVSEWTGTKEIIEKVDHRLVLPLDKDKCVDGLKWFFNLNFDEKQVISKKCKDVISNYTETRAIEIFKKGLFSLSE